MFLLAACAFAVWVTRGEAPPAHTGAWLDAQHLTPRYATVGGLKIRYVRTGQGPTLVLLHGIASSIYSWKEVLPLLSRGHDVIALDFPGFGDSDFERNPSWESMPPLVTGLMDRLGVARATLVGSSMGGAVAVLAASATPQRLDKLVLIDSAGFNLSPADRPAVLRLVNTGLAPLLERLPLRRPLTRLALLQIFHDDSLVTAERLDEYVAPMMRPGAVENLQALLASATPDLAQRFENAARSVNVPALVLWGDDDKLGLTARRRPFHRRHPRLAQAGDSRLRPPPGRRKTRRNRRRHRDLHVGRSSAPVIVGAPRPDTADGKEGCRVCPSMSGWAHASFCWSHSPSRHSRWQAPPGLSPCTASARFARDWRRR